MRTRHLASWLPAVVLATVTLATVQAQVPEQFETTDVYTPFNERTPFLEPGYFDNDLQVFAPAEIDEFGGKQPFTTGIYVDYDRMYVNVSNANAASNPADGTFTWGNRFEAGYMLDKEQNGWHGEFIHIDGPNLDVVNAGGLQVSQSLAEYHSIEVSKVWRADPFHDGSQMEVMIGPKYVGFTDRFFGSPKTENQIVGGQGGVRYMTRKGRWSLAGEGRVFLGQNFQLYQSDSFDEFVPAGEIRGEANFILTKYLALAAGFDVIYYGKGIARGGNPNFTSEDLTIAGATFGLVYNRF